MKKIVALLMVLAIACFAFADGKGNGSVKLSERQLRKYKALYLEAVCQRESGDIVAYYRLLERAVKVNPEGAEALFELGQLSIAFGLDLPVEKYLTKAHELYPENSEYTYELARFYFAMSDDRGIELMRSLLKDESMRDNAYEELCTYYEMKSDYDGFCALLEQWRPLKDDDNYISSRKMQAAMGLGHLDDALLIADTLIANSSADKSHYLILKGEVLLGLKRYDEAMEISKAVEDDEVYSGGSLILKYKYALATGNSELEKSSMRSMVLNTNMPMQTRMAALRNVIEIAPLAEKKALRDSLIADLLPLQEEDGSLYAALIGQMEQENLPDSLMIPLYNKLLDINPSDELSRLHLMQNSLIQKDFAELDRLSKDGLKENPRHPLFYYFAGVALQIDKKDSEALDMFANGLKYVDENTHTELVSRYYSAYADALHKMDRKYEAYVMYDSALVYDSENIMALNNYAYFLSLDNRHLDKAKQMSLKTLEQSPEEPTYLDTYAWIVFLRGEYKEAREYIDKALRFTEDLDDPENVSIIDHAGDIYYHLNLQTEALQFWRKAAKLDPTSELIKKKVQYQKYFKE